MASPISSGGQKKYLDESDDTFNNGKEVTPSLDKPTKTHEDSSLEEEFRWALYPQTIIRAVTSKTQDFNLTNSGANISTSGPHRRRCTEY